MVGHSGKLAAGDQGGGDGGRVPGRGRRGYAGSGRVAHDHRRPRQRRADGDPPTGGPHTYHTTNPVPFILVAPEGSRWRTADLKTGGRLCDITPTVLDIMEIPLAPEMTCQSLLFD